MKQAKVSDLKNQLSYYLGSVRQGETVVVFDRKVPIAELRPVSHRTSTGKLAGLEREGLIRRGSGRLPRKFFTERLGGKTAGVLTALLAEREGGR